MAHMVMFFAFIYQALCLAESAKILFVSPMPFYSIHRTAFRLAKELADKGHQVTFINAFPQKASIQNLKEISVEENIKYGDHISSKLSAKPVHNPFPYIYGISKVTFLITEQTLKNQKVQHLLKSNAKFDVVVHHLVCNEALAGFGYHFNAPIVILTTWGISDINNYLFANPSPTSYIPNIYGSLSTHMSFWERLENFLFSIAVDVATNFLLLKRQKELFHKYFSTNVSLDEVLNHNISLMLTNSHISMTDPVPTVPGIIQVGGLHLKQPENLSLDLQNFMNNSKGVILFSMGSVLKSNFQDHTRAAILSAFAKLEQNVLWKFNGKISNAPENVRIVNWLPQQDILAHPNTKAFISHGGLHSIIEAVYHGVPIIGIPVFGDQKFNVKCAVNLGYAVQLLLEDLTEETLSKALNEILNNSKYQKTAKLRSKIMHDQLVKPLDLAVYWIEHVIRFKGAKHLRSAGLDLAWYQREMIDVIGFIVFVLLCFLFVAYLIFKKLYNYLCLEKAEILSKKKNK